MPTVRFLKIYIFLNIVVLCIHALPDVLPIKHVGV
jgi:hypothetical protein